jgi:hypothetical protein
MFSKTNRKEEESENPNAQEITQLEMIKLLDNYEA